MSLSSVLIRKSTGEIIKRALYPREDMQPIEGLDPDMEWLVIHIPYIAPDYDSRIFELQIVETVTNIPHPVYPWLNQFQITYSTVKRPESDIAINIANAETQANESLFPYQDQLKLIALSIGVLFRNIDGMTLTTKEQAVKDKMLNLAVSIWKNDAALKAKILQLTQGLEPNIDEGWEKNL